jgi:hypothetical protein
MNRHTDMVTFSYSLVLFDDYRGIILHLSLFNVDQRFTFGANSHTWSVIKTSLDTLYLES